MELINSNLRFDAHQDLSFPSVKYSHISPVNNRILSKIVSFGNIVSLIGGWWWCNSLKKDGTIF